MLIPKDNWQDMFRSFEGIEIIPVERIEQVIERSMMPEAQEQEAVVATPAPSLLSVAPPIQL